MQEEDGKRFYERHKTIDSKTIAKGTPTRGSVFFDIAEHTPPRFLLRRSVSANPGWKC